MSIDRVRYDRPWSQPLYPDRVRYSFVSASALVHAVLNAAFPCRSTRIDGKVTDIECHVWVLKSHCTVSVDLKEALEWYILTLLKKRSRASDLVRTASATTLIESMRNIYQFSNQSFGVGEGSAETIPPAPESRLFPCLHTSAMGHHSYGDAQPVTTR